MKLLLVISISLCAFGLVSSQITYAMFVSPTPPNSPLDEVGQVSFDARVDEHATLALATIKATLSIAILTRTYRAVITVLNEISRLPPAQVYAAVNVRDELGWNALHEATFAGNREIVDALLRAGADASIQTGDGDTALNMAAYTDNYPVFVRLLADANARATLAIPLSTGQAPLHWIAQRGNAPGYTRAILHAFNYDIDVLRPALDAPCSEWENRTPLHTAVLLGHVDTVISFLDAGANKNARDRYLWTPLHYAAACGFERIYQVLCFAGADQTARNSDDRTPAELRVESFAQESPLFDQE